MNGNNPILVSSIKKNYRQSITVGVRCVNSLETLADRIFTIFVLFIPIFKLFVKFFTSCSRIHHEGLSILTNFFVADRIASVGKISVLIYTKKPVEYQIVFQSLQILLQELLKFLMFIEYINKMACGKVLICNQSSLLNLVLPNVQITLKL